MNNILHNPGYTTYYSGLPEEITRSEKIYLVKDIENLSLDNLNKKFLEILRNGEKTFAIPEYLEEEDCYFLNTSLDSDCIDSFNIIIYLNSEGPVGYTKFYNDQYIKFIERDNEIYTINSIKIFTKFNISTSFIVNIELNNSLIRIRTNDEDSNKILIEDTKPYNFISIPKVINYLNESDNYVKYTNNISQLLKDPKNMCIITDSVSYYNKNAYLYSIKDFDIQRNPHFLDKIQVGTYKDNIYLYQWNDLNEYSIICLNIINKYGNPKVIAKSTSEVTELLNSVNGEYKIDSVGYKYILLKNKEGKQKIYSTGVEDNESFLISVKTNMEAIIDPFDEDGEIIYVNRDEILTNSVKSPKINQEMCGIFLDVKKKSRDYYLYKKINSWFIFKSTINNLTIYSNINGTLTVSSNIENNPIIINDRCILIQDKDKCEFFFFNGTSFKYDKNYDNSNNENVIIVPNKNGKVHQLIEGLRHSPIGNSLDIPKISYSVFGTLYYIEDNKFKRL
jgi:hypothetical protein